MADNIAAALAEHGVIAEAVNDDQAAIVDELLYPYLNHATTMLEANYATREDIDAAMRFGCGYPVGPLAVLDMVGLDTAVTALEAMHARSGKKLHSATELLKQYVADGRTGVQAGKGFYTYEAPGSRTVVAESGEASEAGATPRAVTKVGVVGTGTMASGIVEVFAKSGFDVTFVARSEDKVNGVLAAITKSLDKAVSRGKMTEDDKSNVLDRITGSTEREALGDVDLVVEAIAEDLDIKLQLFRDFDRICKPGSVLATTTSSLPINEMAAVTSRPADVVGMHFFNPAPIMKLVEVVSTPDTAADVVATVLDVCRSTGKHPVLCGDRAGFIVNALLFPYLNDAVLMLEDGVNDMDAIDAAIKAGGGLPLGPFQLLDVVGNDVSLAIEQTLYNEFQDEGLAPAKTLEQVVADGKLGRKTGAGFHDYS